MGQIKMKQEIKKYLELNKNEITTYSKSQEEGKIFFKNDVLMINFHTKKIERSQINNLS